MNVDNQCQNSFNLRGWSNKEQPLTTRHKLCSQHRFEVDSVMLRNGTYKSAIKLKIKRTYMKRSIMANSYYTWFVLVKVCMLNCRMLQSRYHGPPYSSICLRHRILLQVRSSWKGATTAWDTAWIYSPIWNFFFVLCFFYLSAGYGFWSKQKKEKCLLFLFRRSSGTPTNI